MNAGVSLTLHAWRGFGGDEQRDLFVVRWRLGFATVAVERRDVLVSYRKLRAVIIERVHADGKVGR